MRDLSALGARKATARKVRARQIIHHLRRGDPLPPAPASDDWQDA